MIAEIEKEEQAWTCEISLPIAAVKGKMGKKKTWAFNFCRNAVAEKHDAQPAFPESPVGQGRFSDWSEDMWRMYRYNYHRFVEMVDREIGLLLDELEQSSWLKNTILIFGSDHGDGMSRHLGVGKPTFYQEVVNVPLVIGTLGNSLPIRKDHRDSQHLVSGIDFGRTEKPPRGGPVVLLVW